MHGGEKHRQKNLVLKWQPIVEFTIFHDLLALVCVGYVWLGHRKDEIRAFLYQYSVLNYINKVLNILKILLYLRSQKILITFYVAYSKYWGGKTGPKIKKQIIRIFCNLFTKNNHIWIHFSCDLINNTFFKVIFIL